MSTEMLKIKLATLVGELSIAKKYKSMQYVARALTLLDEEPAQEQETPAPPPKNRTPLFQAEGAPKRATGVLQRKSPTYFSRQTKAPWVPPDLNQRQADLWEYIYHHPNITQAELYTAFPSVVPSTIHTYVTYLVSKTYVIREYSTERKFEQRKLKANPIPGYNRPLTVPATGTVMAEKLQNALGPKTPPASQGGREQ